MVVSDGASVNRLGRSWVRTAIPSLTSFERVADRAGGFAAEFPGDLGRAALLAGMIARWSSTISRNAPGASRSALPLFMADTLTLGEQRLLVGRGWGSVVVGVWV
ncbi:hypothetical protein [Actinokineospora sp. NPDC004072]